MKGPISYDIESELAYMYLIPCSKEFKVDITEEMEENPDLNLDIDRSGRVIGIEFFGNTAQKLKDLTHLDRVYEKVEENGRVNYSFRIEEKNHSKSFEFNGLLFFFSGEDFIGLDIIESNRYDMKHLEALTLRK